jgi:phosphatidylglycerophosphatase A
MLAKFIATAAGAGYSPVAPGTLGTALAVPLAWLAAGLAGWQYALVVVAITAAGIWAAELSDRSWQTHDSGRIVIDEVAGYFVTVALIDRTSWSLLLVGFAVFRVLDIAKPPPIRWVDANVAGGAGVMLDDVAAGIVGAIVMAALAAWLPALP